MHLQDLVAKVKRNVAQQTLHHVTYSGIKFEEAASNGFNSICIYKKIHYLTFDLRAKVTGAKVT